MAHDPEAYKKLRRQFVEAAAKYEPSRYRTFIEKRKQSEEEYLRLGLCEFVGLIPWPYRPSRMCKILAESSDSSERPFSVLRRLSTKAWLLLPDTLSDGAVRAAERFLSPSPEIWLCSAHHELWIWLLWFDAFQVNQWEEPPEVQPAGIDLQPFSSSANLISAWRLDEANPPIPECLAEVVLKKKGSAEAQVKSAADEAERLGEQKRPPRPYRSPEEKDILILAALAYHHKYEDQGGSVSIGNWSSITGRSLAEQAKVNRRDVTEFMQKHFGGQKEYECQCHNRKLPQTLQKLRGEEPGRGLIGDFSGFSDRYEDED